LVQVRPLPCRGRIGWPRAAPVRSIARAALCALLLGQQPSIAPLFRTECHASEALPTFPRRRGRRASRGRRTPTAEWQVCARPVSGCGWDGRRPTINKWPFLHCVLGTPRILRYLKGKLKKSICCTIFMRNNSVEDFLQNRVYFKILSFSFGISWKTFLQKMYTVYSE